MLEAIRIRKAGYGVRMEFDLFYRRYKPIQSAYSNNGEGGKRGCRDVLDVLE